MTNPVKFRWVSRLRREADSVVMPLPLPNINPSIISIASVIAMLGALLFLDNLYWVLLLVLASIFLDWMDGMIARKYNRVSRQGYLIDAVCDRASEGILAVAFGSIWLNLFAFNLLLLIYSLQTRVNFIMPIRLGFIIVIILKIIGIDLGLI